MLSFALLVFSIAAVSDGLDGLFARYFNQYSVLGAYLDPIADKLLLVSAFVSLAVLKIIPPWLTVIVISRDIMIVIGILIFAMIDIPIEMKPSLVSKCTTVAQLSTIFLTLSGTKEVFKLSAKRFINSFLNSSFSRRVLNTNVDHGALE